LPLQAFVWVDSGGLSDAGHSDRAWSSEVRRSRILISRRGLEALSPGRRGLPLRRYVLIIAAGGGRQGRSREAGGEAAPGRPVAAPIARSAGFRRLQLPTP